MEGIKRKSKHEVQEWTVMFLYLWVMFGLYALHQSIIMAQEHSHFSLQGFAIVSALVLSQVMLVVEDMRVAQGRQDSRPIVVTLNESLGFALLLIVFHVLESTIIGVVSGKTIAASFPVVARGHLQGIISFGIIMCHFPCAILRVPRGEPRAGEGHLWRLLMEPRRRIV
jgi:hypothetical protein